MSTGYRYAYDREANALYIYIRAAAPVWQREYTEEIVLDFDERDNLVGIEVLDPGGADLRAIVEDYNLDPHLLNVLDKLRNLMPEALKELSLA